MVAKWPKNKQLGHQNASMDPNMAPRRSQGGPKGGPGDVLGLSWSVLGGCWGGFRGFLGASWEYFERFSKIWSKMRKYKKTLKNLWFFIDFRGFGRVLGLEKSKKSMKIGLERLRESKNEDKRCHGSLKKQKVSQNEDPRRPQGAMTVIGPRATLLNFEPLACPKDQRSLKK